MGDKILTLEDDILAKMFLGPGANQEKLARLLCLRMGKQPPPADFRPDGHAYAVINRGRWLARCPDCKHGAMVVSKKDRQFWCVECEMRKNGRRPRWVIFPTARFMWEIETILLMRPDVENRNWEGYETAAALARENIEHGCVGFAHILQGGMA